jgi:outer membrane protein TolC
MQERTINRIFNWSNNIGIKNRNYFNWIIAIYFYLFLPVSIYSQSDSLYKYLEIAAKFNPSIQQKFSEYQAALERIPQAGSLSDPELTAGVFLSPMELVNGNQVADIRLMQMFPWFGVLKNARDEMSLMANAKYELFRDTKLQVFYDIQRTWYELYKIKMDIIISQKNIEILKTIERLAIVKFKSGSSENRGTPIGGSSISRSGTPGNSTASSRMQTMSSGQENQENQEKEGATSASSSMVAGSMNSSEGNSGLADVYRIQIESGDLENNIALLKNRRNSLMAQLNSYLNRPVTTEVFTYGNITTDSLNQPLIAISDSILAKNPMLGMLEFEKQSLEAREKMVSRMGYPMVGLGLNYSLINKTGMPSGSASMNGKDMIMPMIALTLPIYRKKYNAMQNETRLLETASKQNYQAASNSLQVEYFQAVELYQDAQRRIKQYENQYLLASKSLDLITMNFSSASSDLSDVLRARQVTFDYELKKIEAIADLNTAVAWLKRLGNIEINGGK